MKAGGYTKGKEFTFSVLVSGVQRHPILLLHRRVEVALHILNRLRHQVQAQLSVGVKVVQETCYRSATDTAKRKKRNGTDRENHLSHKTMWCAEDPPHEQYPVLATYRYNRGR